MERFGQAFADGITVARRNLIKVIRTPEILVSVLVSPLVFVLLFAYVFGSSIDIPGGSYREFLVGGAFAMTLTFGATFTGAGPADDMQKGIIDRFRSLPMSRLAVAFGRTASDLVFSLLTVSVMALAGLIVGWRIHEGIGSALVGFGLLLLFAYALPWIMAYVGLLVPSVEVVNSAAGMVLFPLTFVANTFVPTRNLAMPLRVVAEWNPVSSVAQAARAAFGNIPPGAPERAAWPLQHAELYTLLWAVTAIAVFAPLAVGRYKKAAAK